jgi:hypothetical protein
MGLTTEEFAHAIGILSQSVRKRWAETGSYFGVRPVKLPNGRLKWPDDSLERLIAPSKSIEGRLQ